MIDKVQRQLRLGAILGFITVIVSNIVGLIYSPYMLKTIGQAEYGLYSLVTSIIAYLSVLDFGLGNTVVKYVSQYRSEKKVKEQENILGVFILLYSAIGLISIIVGAFFYFNIDFLFIESMSLEEISKMKIMIVLLVFNVSISFPLSVYGSIIISYEKFVFQKIVNLFRIICIPLLMVLLLVMGYRVIGLVIATTVVNIVLLMWNVYYCYARLKVKIKINSLNRDLLIEIWKYSFWVFIGIIASRLYWSSGQFLVGMLQGSLSVAIIALTIQLVNYYISLASVIAGLFLPKVTGMVTSSISMEYFSELFIKVARWQYIILLFVFSGFIIFGKEFIILWVGVEYIDVYLMAAILMGAITIPWTQVLGVNILQACNKHAFRSIIYIITAFSSVIIGYFLVKLFGGIGFVISLSFMIVLNEVVIMGLYYRKIGLNMLLYLRESLSIILTILFFSAIAYYINKDVLIVNTYSVLFFKILLFSVLYVVCVYFLLLNRNEKNEVAKLFRIFKKI